MSRQFRVYLLPDDVTWLVAELRSRLDIRLLQETSETPALVELASPLRTWPANSRQGAHVDVRGFLAARSNADIRQWFAAKRGEWLLAAESEIVEFSGCGFDSTSLADGRFYVQTDKLIGDVIAPKSAEFVAWADRLFRTAKKLLSRSKSLDAWLGPRAAKWWRDGGRLISSISGSAATRPISEPSP